MRKLLFFTSLFFGFFALCSQNVFCTDAYPLHAAAFNNDVKKMSELIASGAPDCTINARNDKMETPLLKAVEGHASAAVDFLLGRGADTDSIAADGTSPVYLAVVMYFTTSLPETFDILENLLKAGANPNFPDKIGNTSLHISCFFDTYSGFIMELLLRYNGDPRIRNNKLQTPLILAAEYSNNDAMGILLKDDRTEINAQDENDWTALHLTVDSSNYEGMLLLLEDNADSNIQNRNYEYTPLFYVKDPSFIYPLAKYNAKLNIRDYKGDTFLHTLAKDPAKNAVSMALIKSGARFRIKNKNKETAYDIARKHRNFKLLLDINEYESSVKKNIIDEMREYRQIKKDLEKSCTLPS